MVRDAIRAWLALESQMEPQSPSDVYVQAREDILRALRDDDRPLSEEEHKLTAACLSMAHSRAEAIELEVGRLHRSLQAVRRQRRAPQTSPTAHINRIC